MTDQSMNALQQLIRARMLELHWSYSDVARRGGLPRSTVHHLASNGRSVRLPNPVTLQRLAVGLDLPLELVRDAAAAAAGFVLGKEQMDDPEIEVLVASLSRLSPEDRRHVAALVRSLLSGSDSDSQRPSSDDSLSCRNITGTGLAHELGRA
jgi:transcriptional regulator with XRE-family HTH domain